MSKLAYNQRRTAILQSGLSDSLAARFKNLFPEAGDHKPDFYWTQKLFDMIKFHDKKILASKQLSELSESADTGSDSSGD